MKRTLTIIIVAFMCAGCAQTINTYGIENIDTIPKGDYALFLYSSGAGDRLRAVFLKNPDAGVEVVPYSVQITTATGTVRDALTFMEKASGYKRISFQGVTHKGKPIGYLLSFDWYGFTRDRIEPLLFEREGKIYFTAREYRRDD